ncbi:glycosyltransferase family 2 protein [Priestia megaterium]
MNKKYSTKSAIIILNYNDYNTTIEFLMLLKKWDRKYIENIIIVDNNSTDNSFSELKKYASDKKGIHLIKSDKNGGYAYGNNYGIKHAIKEFNPEFLIISNPDVIISEDVVNENIEILMKTSYSMIAPIMKNPNGIDCENVAWKLPHWKDDLVLSLSSLRLILGNPVLYKKEERQGEGIKEVDVLPGSFFIVSSYALQKVEYLDENTFLYCEERILSYKLKSQGFKIVLNKDNSYIHNHSVTINKNINSKLKQYNILQQSRRYYLTKYIKINRIQLLVFNMLTKLGELEKRLQSKLKLS